MRKKRKNLAGLLLQRQDSFICFYPIICKYREGVYFLISNNSNSKISVEKGLMSFPV